MRIKTCVLLAFLLLAFVAPTLIQPAKANPNNIWEGVWHQYQWDDSEGDHQPIANVSTTTTVYSYDESQWVKIALVVSVYDYIPYAEDDEVVFRVCLYYDSFADETMLPVPAAYLTLSIQKDTDGSNYYDQAMEVRYSGIRPGFAQGFGLDQSSYLTSTQDEREWWALKAFTYCAGLFYEPVDMVTDLISLAKSWVPQEGPDYMNADWDDYSAYSWWNDPGYDFGYQNPVRQYAFNTIEWVQHSVNPSTYYGIKVWAHVVLHTQHNLIGPVIDTDPVYLRIHRSTQLSISVPFGHGTTDPAPGTHEYRYGETVIVTAIPDEYYNFSYWELDDYQFSTDNPITITMDCDHNLRCQFKQAGSGNPPGGGGGHAESEEPEK